MVYSARRHLPRALRGTKVRGSEIWRSWVLPVYSQQETLAQLEFCDMQRCREARQAPTFSTRQQSLETKERERGQRVSVAGENISTQLQFFAFHLSRFQLFFMAADSIHISHCSLIVNSKPVALHKGVTASRVVAATPRFRETLEDADREEWKKWKPPSSEPLRPRVLAYNSVLTSSSGHPVGLITMIPGVYPPCHDRNMETASFKWRGHCFFSHGRPITGTIYP